VNNGLGVWADARGVFALTWQGCVMPDRESVGCTPESLPRIRTTLHFNDGTGWQPTLNVHQSIAGFFVFPGGPIALFGNVFDSNLPAQCALSLFDVERRTSICSPLDLSYWALQPSFAVSSDLALVAGSALGEWRTDTLSVLIESLPEPMSAIWANADIAYLAGEAPYFWQRAAPRTVTPLPNAPIAGYFSIWAFEQNDVWFGTAAGQLIHYDGASFRIVQVTDPSDGEGVLRLWGQAGQLFYLAGRQFGRVVAGQLEVLLTLPGQRNSASLFWTGMWGLSPSEVYLSVSDSAYSDPTTCRANYLLWFDGATFHRF
jgi:hypothetical protein